MSTDLNNAPPGAPPPSGPPKTPPNQPTGPGRPPTNPPPPSKELMARDFPVPKRPPTKGDRHPLGRRCRASFVAAAFQTLIAMARNCRDLPALWRDTEAYR